MFYTLDLAHRLCGVEVVFRTSLVGLGRLTDRQLGKPKTRILAFISAAGIRLNGYALVIDGNDIVRCDRVCAAFIRWVDAAAPPPLT